MTQTGIAGIIAGFTGEGARSMIDASINLKADTGTLNWQHPAGGAETLIARLDMLFSRSVTIVHRNDAGSGQNINMFIYVGNIVTPTVVLATMKATCDEISTGLLSNAGTDNAFMEAMSAARGIDYSQICGKYRWLYITGTAAGATVGIDQHLDIMMKS